MAKGTFYGEDICIYLSVGEILNLGQLKLEDDKLVRPSFEVRLDTDDDRNLKAIVRVEDFEELGDGIRVDRTDYGFSVEINDRAYWRIRDNGSFGTRYNGSDKINFFKI